MDPSFRPILPMRRPGDSDETLPTLAIAVPKNKRKAISQACLACWKGKMKCDGQRPICQACLSRKRDCVYEFEEGRPQIATLQSEIRLLKEQAFQFHSANPVPASETQAQTQSLPNVSSAPASSSRPSTRRSLPTDSATQEAVNDFFGPNYRLFHLFTNSQALSLKESIWKDPSSDSRSIRADICCLMAVAAVGAQYSDISNKTNTSNTFYSVAKLYLDDVLEERPLDAIKVSALLCRYNVMYNIDTSLAYADIGLGLWRRYGLYDKLWGPSTFTDANWANYRTGWRTLIFMSTCLSATVACKSGCQDTSYRLFPSEIVVDDASNASGVIQTEMARIGALKARVLYPHVGGKDFGFSNDSIVSDLEDWYEDLPKVMRFQDISWHSLPSEMIRSIYLAHLFYFSSSQGCRQLHGIETSLNRCNYIINSTKSIFLR